ncbi:MFS transporter, partial [Moraxella caviae]
VFQSILPELYHHDILPKVNGNIASINSFTGIIAPAILGVLFGFLSNKQIALIIPLLYLVSAAAFYGIVYRAHTTKHKINIIKDNKEAVNYLKTQTTLMDFSYLFFFVNFGLRMILSSLIWLYTTHFYLAKNLTAYHFIFIGIMSILGAKIAGKYIVGKYTTDKIIFRSSIVIAGLIFSLALFDNVFYLTFIWGLVSLFSMFIIVAYFTYRQQQTERALLSRVVALTRLISYLAIPPAVLLSGYLLDAFGAPNLIYFIAGACVLLPSLYFANKSSAART